MQPQTTGTGNTNAGESGEGGDGEFNTWLALQRSTDKKRADILADIVGHPKGMPTIEELDYMNPDLSDDSIRRHCKTLMEVGVVDVVELPKGERVRDFPYQFYQLTDEARELFDKNNLFPEDGWKRQYDAVKKTPRITEVETMPRPES